MLEARNKLVDWQVAPAEHEINNYDHFKIDYRQQIKNFLKPLSAKSVRNMPFVTISTNVLCADPASSSETIDPIDRDIYLPLEIVLTKWSLSEAPKGRDERVKLKSNVWMVDPGRPVRNCNSQALDHKKLHKIDYDSISAGKDPLIEADLVKISKEINAFLTPNRTVFSIQLRHCRQDLGSLKWLNRETGYKMKPIQVFSLEDLYVCLMRYPNFDQQFIGQGVARHQMYDCGNFYDPRLQCKFHVLMAKQDSDSDCGHCAKAVAECCTHKLMDDANLWSNLFQRGKEN